uniref:Alpha-1,2-Mannosidase n=1 Tax=Glossina austeni TaxID=7395 RepID=A0A1A9VH85_GLOAU
MKNDQLKRYTETRTACAGTMLLEFAALSTLTGDHIFEVRAHAAIDALWKLRNRGSDLMGAVLKVHSGDWVRRDSDVGAGIDSYYEYLFKSYFLLGDDKYWARFNRHDNAVMKYVSDWPLFLDVLMDRPHAKSRNFMDVLLAFWPGLQLSVDEIRLIEVDYLELNLLRHTNERASSNSFDDEEISEYELPPSRYRATISNNENDYEENYERLPDAFSYDSVNIASSSYVSKPSNKLYLIKPSTGGSPSKERKEPEDKDLIFSKRKPQGDCSYQMNNMSSDYNEEEERSIRAPTKS